MNRVGKFSKVSYDQWAAAIRSQTDAITEDAILDLYHQIKLPRRATAGSAGYDIYSPIWVSLERGESIKIPTGIRCEMDEGWVLTIYPRSGLGTKHRFVPDNLVGVVDGDYYYSDNEGHIWCMMTYNGHEDRENRTLEINRGDAIAQAIFLPYGITKDDNATGIRNGGFGSTGGTQ